MKYVYGCQILQGRFFDIFLKALVLLGVGGFSRPINQGFWTGLRQDQGSVFGV